MTGDTVRAPVVFGERARSYDRLRPDYPPAALSEALATQTGAVPGSALDIGCGTGKLATALTSLGHRVMGLEPDPRMAAVASAKGLAVEVGSFEAWDPGERRFDTVACGQAWHWLRPGERTDKAARCLRPGGQILLAWNLGSHPPLVGFGLNRVYASVLPDGLPTGDGGRANLTEADIDEYAAELRAHGFSSVTKSAFPWRSCLTSQEWCELLGTDSRHLALPKAVRRTLLHKVARYLDAEHGGEVSLDYRCVVVTATTAG
ncbi:class I SAM-dependent methyltransferase [Streptomyces sp. NPDC002499]